MPMVRRTAVDVDARCRRCPAPSMVSVPSTRAPGSTSCIRLIDRRKVDLPQPDGPISAVTVFGSTIEVDVLDRLERAVVGGDVGGFDALGHDGVLLSSAERGCGGPAASRRRSAAARGRRASARRSRPGPARTGRRRRPAGRRRGPATTGCSWNGLKLIAAPPPATSSTGAVSPAARATASMTPVTMPGSGGRQHHLQDRLPLRYAEGVRALAQRRGHQPQHLLGGADDRRQHQHRSARARRRSRRSRAAVVEAGETTSTQKARTNRPATIEGMPVITSTKKRIAAANRPRPYSTM